MSWELRIHLPIFFNHQDIDQHLQQLPDELISKIREYILLDEPSNIPSNRLLDIPKNKEPNIHRDYKRLCKYHDLHLLRFIYMNE